MFAKIVLAADGSEQSLRATFLAVELAKHNQAVSIHVVYVIDDSTTKSDVLNNWSFLGTVNGHKQDKLSRIEEKLKGSGLHYELKVVRGEPGTEIVTYANNHQMDIIVMGSRGLNALQTFVLGSVSDKVVKRAKCPVMIVK